jgi:hypothetical protein
MAGLHPGIDRGTDPDAARRRVDRGGAWAVGGWIILFLVVVIGRAAGEPLWYDELFSVHLARLPRVADLWAALAGGTDLNPPLSHLLVRWSQALFGDGPLAARLPSALGVATLSLCLYAVVARRLRPAYAWCAALVPAVTVAFDFAYEARPYGVLLGESGLALASWQLATEGRRVAAVVLALALAAAVSTHFYAVLIFVPLGLGELARSWSRRRVDLPIWAALFVGLIPLLIFEPNIRAARAYTSFFWSKVGPTNLFDAYRFLAKDAVVPLFAILVLLMIDARRAAARPTTSTAPEDARADVPGHELIAALGFLALPPLGVVLARLAAGGAFTDRYALPGVIGPGLLLAYAGARLAGGRAAPGAAMAAILLGWFLFGEAVHLRRGAPADLALEPKLFEPVSGADLPVVVTRSLIYLQADHELPRPLSDRLVFLTSKGESTDERALKSLSRWISLDVEDFDAFVGAHDGFFAFGSPNDPAFQALREVGARMTLLQTGRFRNSDVVLVRVDQRGKG